MRLYNLILTLIASILLFSCADRVNPLEQFDSELMHLEMSLYFKSDTTEPFREGMISSNNNDSLAGVSRWYLAEVEKTIEKLRLVEVPSAEGADYYKESTMALFEAERTLSALYVDYFNSGRDTAIQTMLWKASQQCFIRRSNYEYAQTAFEKRHKLIDDKPSEIEDIMKAKRWQ